MSYELKMNINKTQIIYKYAFTYFTLNQFKIGKLEIYLLVRTIYLKLLQNLTNSNFNVRIHIGVGEKTKSSNRTKTKI